MKMDDITMIKVADYFKIPGARHREDGDNSAQQFFEDILKEIADDTLLKDKRKKLVIDLDNTVGYPSSFISELSMLMSLQYKKAAKITKRIMIVSEDNPGLIETFWYGFKQNYNQ